MRYYMWHYELEQVDFYLGTKKTRLLGMKKSLALGSARVKYSTFFPFLSLASSFPLSIPPCSRWLAPWNPRRVCKVWLRSSVILKFEFSTYNDEDFVGSKGSCTGDYNSLVMMLSMSLGLGTTKVDGILTSAHYQSLSCSVYSRIQQGDMEVTAFSIASNPSIVSLLALIKHSHLRILNIFQTHNDDEPLIMYQYHMHISDPPVLAFLFMRGVSISTDSLSAPLAWARV